MVSNVAQGRVDSRYAMQRAILAYLAQVGQPIPDGTGMEKIGHLPRIRDIIDALGYPPNRSSFASVSRSLAKLRRTGKVEAYYGLRCARGKGARYSLPPD